jgi:hypothetical protein
MPDVRCPMCSKPNPSDAATCRFCGARLKPLVPGESPLGGTPDRADASLPGEERDAGQGEGGGDWLERIRPAADEGSAPEPEPPTEGAGPPGEQPDWLGRLRPAGAEEEEGPPEGDVPDWLSAGEGERAEAEAEPGGEVPDWLARIRERQEAEARSQPKEPEAEEDWLGRLRTGELPPAKAAPSPATPTPPTPPEVPPAVPEPAAKPKEPVSRPVFREEVFKDDKLFPAPDIGLEPEEEGAESPALPWSPPGDRLTPSRGFGRKPSAEAKVPGDRGATEKPAARGGLDSATEPAWLSEAREHADGDLPHVPALIGNEGSALPPDTSADVELAPIDLPDWLSELKSTPPQARPESEGLEDKLAPATLPSWLEAMRPMETFRPMVEIQPEAEQEVEAAGPLAGLRGVLLAEPVVAMPHQSTAAAARLDVTERQFALGDLLRRLVEDEERELPPAARGRRRLPLVRWAVAIVLILAVILPSFVGGPSFPVPTLVPPGLPSLINLVNALPADRPVLLVFDYEPGYSGELEAVAGPLLEHLMTRGLRLATVSTRPSGPPLAERLIQEIGKVHQYTNGEDYLHLGYLPGGPAAVQLFAQDPRLAVAGGFLLPEGTTGATIWQSPVVRDVTRLSDFGAVVVIAAGTEIARTWVEQASPMLGETPLVMVLSAGVEPLVRPYYEALNPQVDAILAGLPAAVAYEQANGQPAQARALWNAFGTGMLVAELSLVLGVAYGLVSWLLRPGGVEARR